MRTHETFVRTACTALAIASIANGLQIPIRADVDGPRHQQQPMSYNNRHNYDDNDASHSYILDMLAQEENFNQLFQSLTSVDISHLSTIQQHSLKPLQITLGHYTSPKTHCHIKPKNKLSSHNDDHPATLPISMSTIGGYPIFHAPIAIGQPAQPFNAWLNPRLDGIYVRSSKCSKRDCGRGFTYDAEKSESKEPMGRFEVHPEGWTVGGDAGREVLRLVSLDVQGVGVGEVDEYQGDEMFWWVLEFVVDGALGLAPPNANTSALAPFSVPNPLCELVKSHAVEHNVLTLTLPDSVEEEGSLQIGQVQRAHEEATMRIPLANSSNPSLAHTWHVALDSISLSGHPNLHMPLKSVHARLDFEPNIGLPPQAANKIYEALGAKQNDLYRGAMVDCNAMENLPDLVFSVGGSEVVLTREEYSFEQNAWGYKVCVIAIVPTEGEEVAVLGTNFLRKFHVVIDIDEGELGLIDRE